MRLLRRHWTLYLLIAASFAGSACVDAERVDLEQGISLAPPPGFTVQKRAGFSGGGWRVSDPQADRLEAILIAVHPSARNTQSRPRSHQEFLESRVRLLSKDGQWQVESRLENVGGRTAVISDVTGMTGPAPASTPLLMREYAWFYSRSIVLGATLMARTPGRLAQQDRCARSVRIDRPALTDDDLVISGLDTAMAWWNSDDVLAVEEAEAWFIGNAAIAARPLAERIRDGEPVRRERAGRLLGRLGEPAVESLLWLLQEDDPHVQGVAVRALMKLRDPRAVEPLLALLEELEDDPDSIKVRRAAIVTLGLSGDRRALPALHLLAGDSDPKIRISTALSLGRLHDEQTLVVLSRLAQDEAAAVRRTAVQALGKTGRPETAEALRRAIADDDPAVRDAAVQALAVLGTP